MKYRIDLTGQKFGYLLVIEKTKSNKWGMMCWLCKCDCGNLKIIIGADLRKCFCMKRR